MTIPFLNGLREIAGDYDAFILDLWGVVHNGREPYPGVLDCMAHLREGGRPILLLSNAPRTSDKVVAFLEGIGVPRTAYDDVLTSGDLTRQALALREDPWHEALGRKFFHLGPDRDLGLLDGLEYTRVARGDEADFILCTGLYDDENEQVGDYRELMEEALALDLPLICANPDMQAMRGDKKILCAGSLAVAYQDMGGKVSFHGKPHRHAYRESARILGLPGGGTDGFGRVLAVGDSLRTDIAGAQGVDMASVLVAGGIHAEEWGVAAGGMPSREQLEESCAMSGHRPTVAMPHMVW